MAELPDFDTLLEMAENNPEELEELRKSLCEEVIESAPEHLQRRLRGIQFKIDAVKATSKSPMRACVTVSGMMHDSFQELRSVLNAVSNTSLSSVSEPCKDAPEVYNDDNVVSIKKNTTKEQT